MAKVRIKIAGREYALTCADGDEDRVRDLGQRLDQEATAIADKMSFVSESNLLVMIALQMADKASGPLSTSGAQKDQSETIFDSQTVAAMLDQASEGIESIAASLNKV